MGTRWLLWHYLLNRQTYIDRDHKIVQKKSYFIGVTMFILWEYWKYIMEKGEICMVKIQGHNIYLYGEIEKMGGSGDECRNT